MKEVEQDTIRYFNMAASKIIDIRMMFESLLSLSRPIVSQPGPPMSPNGPEPACTKALRSLLALINPGLHPSCSYSGGNAHKSGKLRD